MPSVMLCADSETVCHPELIGLDGERLDAQSWLAVQESAEEARAFMRKCTECTEAWVVSSNDIEAINLAATLKHDSPQSNVFLVSFEKGGSLQSRVHAAGLDGLMDRGEFTQRYCLHKRNVSLIPAAGATHIRSLNGRGLGEGSEYGVSSLKGNQQRELMPDVSASVVPGADSEFLRGLDLGGPKNDCMRSSLSLTREVPSGVSNVGKHKLSTAEHRAFVLMVASASGGSGKSTVAALSGIFSQSLGQKTLLIDADFQFGDLRAFLGVRDTPSFEQIIEGIALPEPHTDGLPALIAAPHRMEEAERLAEYLPQVIERASASFDVIIVNTGSLWGEVHAVLAERASRTFFLIDQRSSSLQACKRALSLCDRCGIPTAQFLFVVNRYKRGAPVTSLDASCQLSGASVFELRDGGRVVDELMMAGLPFDLIRDENPLCTSLKELVANTLPGVQEPVQTAKSTPEFWPSFGRGVFARLRKKSPCPC